MPKGFPINGINKGWFKKGHKLGVGRKISSETRKKMSLIKKGKMPKYIPSFKGHKHTQEFKDNFGIIAKKFGSKRIGKRNYNWKGGKFSTSGYFYRLSKDHPNSDKHGYILEHRFVMSNHLKRHLLKNERIHHIDGNKSNNTIINLFLFQSEREHRLCHHSMEKVVFELYKNGVVKFDKKSGRYYI